ncbi:MAG: hypothetical protein QNL62_00690 [Gammaproteobacteria bacterium]|nr:hypothetical protein [Gammaproteobacteria bacterium]
MSKIKYSIHEGELIVNGKEIKLPYPAEEALIFQDILIVRVEPAIGKIYNRNVFALLANGEIKWQISESPHGTEADKPYMNIYLSKDGKLIAGNWNGVDYFVGIVDGSIIASSFKK